MKSVKIMQIIAFGFLFIAFALAYNGNSTNPNCFNTDAETCDAVAKVAKILKAKRELSDAPTILVYIAIAAVIVIPQIPQLDV